jgi:hypothetical protein
MPSTPERIGEQPRKEDNAPARSTPKEGVPPARFPAALSAPSTEEWSARPPQERQEFVDELLSLFLVILNELVEEANLCVQTVKSATASYKAWRLRLIMATGGLQLRRLFHIRLI